MRGLPMACFCKELLWPLRPWGQDIKGVADAALAA